MSTRNRIVEIAQGEIGYVEGAGKHTKYGDWYGLNDAWCDIFISWLANQVGILDTLIPKEAYVPTTAKWFKDKGLFQNNSYIPSKGDLIMFDYNYNGTPDHIGIVEKVENGIITTIEGNKGHTVKRQQYSIGNASIFGFGIVEYTDDEPEPVPEPADEYTERVKTFQTLLTNAGYNIGKYGVDGVYGVNSKTATTNAKIYKGAKGNIVKFVQEQLIRKGYALATYGADGNFGAETHQAVVQFQKDNGLYVDGWVGGNTMALLLK